MRIAYVVPWSERLDSGVMKKVEAQLAHWERAGHEGRVFMLRRIEPHDAPPTADGARDVVTYTSTRERPGSVRRLVQLVDDWQPSLVYARYDVWWPSLPKLARRVPVVIEVNTDDVIEQRAASRLPRRAFNRTTRRAVLSSCAGLVFVTEELARRRRFGWFRGPTTVIANSFDLASVPPPSSSVAAPAAASQAAETRLVFLGTGEPWHGVDELVALAGRIPEWHFDLVGVAASQLDHVGPNVQCHGFLPKSEYEPILRAAAVGVGSLALYRAGLHEASPLKVREYLAHGLPVIVGFRDTDFPDGAPFVLQLPSEPGAVGRSTDAVRTFVLEWRGRRVDRASIAHLDTAVKESARLAFFGEIVARRGA